MTSGGAEHYYRHDRLGSVTDVIGNLGTSEATYTYEPYGARRTTAGTLTNLMGFAGQYTDPGGLQYLRARYYDTTTGRFLTTDPVAPAITAPTFRPTSMPTTDRRWRRTPVARSVSSPTAKGVSASARSSTTPRAPSHSLVQLHRR